MAPAFTNCWRLSSVVYQPMHIESGLFKVIPECVMFSKAPVALRWTRMSFDLASFVNGGSAPERAILALLSSWVARFVMQPTALHCTSTLLEFIWRIKGVRPPNWTMRTLLCAMAVRRMLQEATGGLTIDSEVAQGSAGSPLDFYVRTFQ